MKHTVRHCIEIVCGRTKPRCYSARARTCAYVQMDVAMVLAATRVEGRKEEGTFYF